GQVGRPLVTPPRLAEPVGVRAEDRCQRRAEGWRRGHDAFDNRRRVEPEVAKLGGPVAHQPLGQSPAVGGRTQVPEPVALVVGGEHEPVLRRDRDPGVRVQHELQQGGAGAGAADDDDRPVAGLEPLPWDRHVLKTTGTGRGKGPNRSRATPASWPGTRRAGVVPAADGRGVVGGGEYFEDLSWHRCSRMSHTSANLKPVRAFAGPDHRRDRCPPPPTPGWRATAPTSWSGR